MSTPAGRSRSRIAAIALTVLAALSVAGVFTAAMLSAFVFDRFDAHGEIPIPGDGTVYLPEGRVSISFHTRTDGNGTSLPPLKLSIDPPPGGVDPVFTEDHGASVTVGNDVHRQVWVAQVPREGGYRVAVDGPVGGYVDPRLAFGDTGRMDGWIWVMVGVSFVTVDLAVAAWFIQRMRGSRPASTAPGVAAPADPYVPTDEGVRLEQLKTIAGLRDSGALTESEYDAEKRRILRGYQ